MTLYIFDKGNRISDNGEHHSRYTILIITVVKYDIVPLSIILYNTSTLAFDHTIQFIEL